jgi:phosphoglycolate phosphatase-like HAD superfamily hydrolase
MASARPAAFLFDLDGTLVDSVYEHVLAWREALEQVGIALSVWRIHRRIGMSGGLLINALLRETGAEISSHFVEELQRRHADAYARRSEQVRPLPGAKELLEYLTSNKVRWAVATSGPNGERPAQPKGDRGRPGARAGDHPRPGRACKA